LPGEERVSDDIVVAKAEPEPVRQRAQELQQEATATVDAGLQDVFFAFDSWKLTESAKRALEADGQWLKANVNHAITIEGHCDERGTQAYNLVLGEKRAQAVRNYLIDLGVDPRRLAVTSYGKDRPFCREHNEECYRQNRRGHLVLRVK
jgi:peptidoglycan-associated lipoprotein